MPNQSELEPQRYIQSKLGKIMVILNPRDNPFLKSYLSLESACQVANSANIDIISNIISDGVYGFHNSGYALSNFMESDATHIFFSADDMTYPSDIFIRLLTSNKDIVAGIYRTRDLNIIQPAIYAPDVEEFKKNLRTGGLVQTDFISGHTMLIKRNVIEKMIVDYPELEYINLHTNKTEWSLFMPIIENKRMFMDDWSFSIRAKRSGFELWYNYGVKCGHWAGDFISFPSEV